MVYVHSTMRWRSLGVFAFTLGLGACLHPPGDPAANSSPPAAQPPVSVEPSPAASEAPPAATDAAPPAATATPAGPIFAREISRDAGPPASPDGSAPPANGQTQARGSIDKEIIRRVIRSHIHEVKTCYETQLLKRPGLAVRIVVEFTIAASGEVIASALQSSTMMRDAALESCVVEAVRHWQFPKLFHRDRVTITYPFTLTPAKPAP